MFFGMYQNIIPSILIVWILFYVFSLVTDIPSLFFIYYLHLKNFGGESSAENEEISIEETEVIVTDETFKSNANMQVKRRYISFL